MHRLQALLAVLVLVAACAGTGGPAAANPGDVAAVGATGSPAPAATPAPVRTPKDVTPSGMPITTPAPTRSPWPETDGVGAEAVGGRDLLLGLTRPYSTTEVDGVGRIRGGQITQTSEMNDPRVDGTVTFDFSVDAYGSAGSQWGTMRIVNDGGAWDGTCTGGSWAEGDGIAWSCWLAGSGAHDGWTYYRQLSKEPLVEVMSATGILYPGEVPAP